MKPESILAGHKAALADCIDSLEAARFPLRDAIRRFQERNKYTLPKTLLEDQIRLEAAIKQAKEVVLW